MTNDKSTPSLKAEKALSYRLTYVPPDYKIKPDWQPATLQEFAEYCQSADETGRLLALTAVSRGFIPYKISATPEHIPIFDIDGNEWKTSSKVSEIYIHEGQFTLFFENGDQWGHSLP